MRVRLSSQAVRDLQGVHAWVERDNPDRAIRFIAKLRDAMKRLATMPNAFPLIPRYERHGIRRRSCKGYGILYSVRHEGLFVHRIIGPGQDHDRALGLT
ncbi:hypothetical protein ASE85_12325 [Sphingobium sp. Leaf26]|uniref:type II toxin-antitoxin system RelE/ParE family toxin n=1 Tax=Sphingobium sp. Leaf26 TaxID=1735693 RepID=UPI0006FBEC98|nr:type II toxin-antitoxin system RelE/ParE family toxin [Sphingobium sp. Leaf26]KQM98626.1 hypothetical protein ASE85_12325 [Sphingobium sp. Leaf26]